MLDFIYTKLVNLIKYAYVSLSVKDDEKVALTQASFLGKTANVQVISPYGLSVHLPLKTKLLLFNIQGIEENRAAIGFSQDERFKNLEEGEVAVGSPKTQTYVKFDKDGNIEIIGKGKINVTTTGDIDFKCDNFNIDATQVNLGEGGNKIARLGDEVTVGTDTGTITSSGNNTSI